MLHENHQTHPVCPWWLTWTFDNPLRRLVHKPERLFAAHLESGMSAIDVGCGFGFLTLGMARLIGTTNGGKVLAVDLQEQMLQRVRKRARKAGLEDVIHTRRCSATSLEIGPVVGDQPADFALAFWMAHEVPQQSRLFAELFEALRPGGLLFIAEPRLDVNPKYFANELKRIENAGFRLHACPHVALSLAAVFTKP